MSDRPTPTNGKRYRAWGTRELCPACGACLCFGCHPQGPCVEERLEAGSRLTDPGLGRVWVTPAVSGPGARAAARTTPSPSPRFA